MNEKIRNGDYGQGSSHSLQENCMSVHSSSYFFFFICITIILLEFEFFIFICLFFIEGSLEVLYRVFQNKSKRHCTEAATSVPVTSNRNPSAFPAL